MRKYLAQLLRAIGILDFHYLARSISLQPVDSELMSDEILVVESDGILKWACLKCPGGCNIMISLSLNQNRRPRWQLSKDWFGRPTVTPSVHQLNDCRCHFWIRDGKVEWCVDGRPRQ